VSHVSGDEIFVSVRGDIAIEDVPLRAWLRCHHLANRTVTEFRALVVEAVAGSPARLSLRPREATPRPDRRRHRRTNIVSPGTVRPAESTVAARPAETRDISLGGVRLVTGASVNEGDVIEVSLTLPTGAVEATAVVLGKTMVSARSFELRCQYVKLTEASKATLRALARTST
jgi:hypothetical protein